MDTEANEKSGEVGAPVEAVVISRPDGIKKMLCMEVLCARCGEVNHHEYTSLPTLVECFFCGLKGEISDKARVK